MKTSLILLLLLIPFNVISQCQQYIFSTVPATEWSTWTYVNCETLDTNTFSIPCCQYTLPRCAIIGSPTLIDPYVGTGDLEGIIQNFGNLCD
mgnify:CR=1 FL=1